MPVYAQSIPALPHAFYGTLTINDHPAPGGTSVEARGNDVKTGIAGNPILTTVVGEYGDPDPLKPRLVVQGDILPGTLITFYVNNYSTGQTWPFSSGATTELNLTVTIPPTIGYSPLSFNFSATQGGANPPNQTLSIWNAGVNPTAMNWSVTDDVAWLSLSPASGTSSGEVDSVTVSVNISGMTAGSYPATITILAPGATNHPQTVPVSLAIAPPPPPPPPPPPVVVPGITDITVFITPEGVFIETITAGSFDGLAQLIIAEGTIALINGEPLAEVTMLQMEDPPPLPADSSVIGLVYDFGPDGATFDPPITLTIIYDPALIPEGVAEENMVIAMWHAGEWVNLVSIVDPVANTITVQVSHFTAFAVLAYTPPAIITWPLIGGIIAAIVVAGLLIFFFLRRRRMAA